MPFGGRVFLARARLIGLVAALVLGAASCTGNGQGLIKHYEYEEEIYLSLDGSATIYVNASVPALVYLRGLDLDPRPNARLDRARVRNMYTTPVTRVARVSTWRRFGRRFVQIRVAVDDIRRLGDAGPFSWSTYRFELQDDQVVYRQAIGGPEGRPVGTVGWTGRELVAVRLHLPARIHYHNAGADNLKRGNILVWEQLLSDRQAGVPLEMEVRMAQASILYSTLLLFAASGALALVVLAFLIWWVMRRGRTAAV
ncbi:MAG: hypothetical protein AB1806_16075 [Acidobacteriota bacterium]